VAKTPETDVLDVVNHELACTVDVMLSIAGSVADFTGAPVSAVRTRVTSRYPSQKIVQKVSVKSNTPPGPVTKVLDAAFASFVQTQIGGINGDRCFEGGGDRCVALTACDSVPASTNGASSRNLVDC
jgi:hypothetical protein